MKVLLIIAAVVATAAAFTGTQFPNGRHPSSTSGFTSERPEVRCTSTGDCSNSPHVSYKFLCPMHRLGMTPECPALSCKQIISFNPWAIDGKYYMHIAGEEVIFPAYCDMGDGGWTLTFKVPSGIELDSRHKIFNPADIWSGLADFEEGDLSYPYSSRNDVVVKPYKNRFVRHWVEQDVKKVKMVLLHQQRVVKTLWFDARGSNHFNWFSPKRLIRTWPRWTDLETELNKTAKSDRVIFGIEADLRPFKDAERTWIINKNFGFEGCSSDEGWLVAVDARASKPMTSRSFICSWEQRTRGMHWLFSKLPTKARWSNFSDTAVADGVMIFVW